MIIMTMRVEHFIWKLQCASMNAWQQSGPNNWGENTCPQWIKVTLGITTWSKHLISYGFIMVRLRMKCAYRNWNRFLKIPFGNFTFWVQDKFVTLRTEWKLSSVVHTLNQYMHCFWMAVPLYGVKDSWSRLLTFIIDLLLGDNLNGSQNVISLSKIISLGYFGEGGATTRNTEKGRPAFQLILNAGIYCRLFQSPPKSLWP